MATPKRYSKGVTNVAWDDPLAMLPTMSPTKVHLMFDDFQSIIKGAINTGNWVSTTATGNTIVMGSDDGGNIIITATTDTDYSGLQKSLMFGLEAGKQLWMGTRFKLSHATTNGFKIGLSDVETDFVPDMGLFFHKADDAATVLMTTLTTGAVVQATSASICTPSTSYQVLEMYFDGVDTFYGYCDGVYVAQMSTASFTTTVMTPWIGFIAGAASMTMSVDYLYVAKER